MYIPLYPETLVVLRCLSLRLCRAHPAAAYFAGSALPQAKRARLLAPVQKERQAASFTPQAVHAEAREGPAAVITQASLPQGVPAIDCDIITLSSDGTQASLPS